MLNVILMLIPVAIIVVLALAARQPDNFSVTRSCNIPAPASAIFPHVNNLPNWHAWSPWAKLDPNATTTFAGPIEGLDAKMSWSGNNKIGVGSMTITESQPNDYIKFKLDFLKPMQATNFAEFTFKTEGEQTTVTWSMTGVNNFMGKVMGLIMNCEKMVGGQFEKGLADLTKVVTEKT